MPEAQYWRDRAEEVRASAEAMHDPVARQTLLKTPTNTRNSHCERTGAAASNSVWRAAIRAPCSGHAIIADGPSRYHALLETPLVNSSYSRRRRRRLRAARESPIIDECCDEPRRLSAGALEAIQCNSSG